MSSSLTSATMRSGLASPIQNSTAPGSAISPISPSRRSTVPRIGARSTWFSSRAVWPAISAEACPISLRARSSACWLITLRSTRTASRSCSAVASFWRALSSASVASAWALSSRARIWPCSTRWPSQSQRSTMRSRTSAVTLAQLRGSVVPVA